MLARTGNKLYQAARHLERAEQLASYTSLYYLTAMDNPLAEQKTTSWDFLLELNGAKAAYYAHYAEAKKESILRFIALDKANPASILMHVSQARELAKRARDILPVALWEHINCFYHEIRSFSDEKLQRKGFHAFARIVVMYSYTIKGYLDTAMIRNEGWTLLMLGYHLERAIKTNTLVLAKLRGISHFEEAGPVQQQQMQESYALQSLLINTGGLEMYKQAYQKNVNRADFLNFMLYNPLFPKSLAFNLDRLHQLSRITDDRPEVDKPFALQVAELVNYFALQRTTVWQDGREQEVLQKSLQQLQEIAAIMETEQLANSAVD